MCTIKKNISTGCDELVSHIQVSTGCDELVSHIQDERAEVFRVLCSERVRRRLFVNDGDLLWIVSPRAWLLGAICEYDQNNHSIPSDPQPLFLN